MKTFITFCFLLPCYLTIAQTIRIADNNPLAPTGNEIFATVQAAVDASSDGDIIYITPSETMYDEDVIISAKSLTLYGIGFNPDKDKPTVATLKSIELSGAGASNTVISGVNFDTFFGRIRLGTDTGTPYTLSGVTIESCNIMRIEQLTDVNQVDNLVITRCLIGQRAGGFGNPIIGIDLSLTLGATSNVIISNNILFNDRFSTGGSIKAANLTLITNNLFIGINGQANNATKQLNECLVTNNVFYGARPNVSTNCIFTNNLSFNTADNTLPDSGANNTGSGNLVGVDPMLTNVGFSEQWSFSWDPTPLPGSPLLNAGTDGSDIGITGSVIPFSNTGSTVPVIRMLNTQTLINEGESLNVTIEAIGK